MKTTVQTTNQTQDSHSARKGKVRKPAVARHLSISLRSVDNQMAAGRLPYYRVGGIILFDLDEVDEALAKFRVEAVGE